MKAILLRFDAPLISFGGPMVDQNGVVQRFPGLSMLVGLLANALGWDRREYRRMDALQDRLRYAARVDRRGEALVDYQTVDLGARWMLPEVAGWTTRGRIAKRGGANAELTHQRYRHYRADSIHTVAIALTGEEYPDVDDLGAALREPLRPLFIGRKCCLPASPIFIDVVEGDSLLGVLAALTRSPRGDDGLLAAIWWDGDDAVEGVGKSRVVAVSDERDWRNSIHVGRRLMREGHVDPPAAAHV
jgi:CRISPR system Cascade subunit CasD